MTKAKTSTWQNAPLDAETRVTSDHHQSLRVWLRMLACTNLIGTHVRQKLQAQFGITLPRFDLMAQLERAPQGLKMGELTRRLMVTGGKAGQQQFQRMAAEHERWVVDLFDDLTVKQKTLLAELLTALKRSATERLLAAGGPR